MDKYLVEPTAYERWSRAYSAGSDKRYPNIDLVRLDAWFFQKKSGKLLEYGFGCGVNLIHLLSSGYDVDAVEIIPEAKNLVESKLESSGLSSTQCRLHLLDVTDEKLPFQSSYFDYITCVSVLSLLGSKERISRLLSEFHRVLKRGGKLIVDINDAKSDFAKDGIPQGDDRFLYPANPRGNDTQAMTVCLSNSEDFRRLLEPFFQVDHEGYSEHKLMHSHIKEYIFCCHK